MRSGERKERDWSRTLTVGGGLEGSQFQVAPSMLLAPGQLLPPFFQHIPCDPTPTPLMMMEVDFNVSQSQARKIVI